MNIQAISIALCLWSLKLGVCDQLRGRLPNLWLAPAVLLAMIWMLKFGQAPTGISITDAWAGVGMALILLLPGYLRGLVGAGDVKYLATMGLFAGFDGVLIVTALGYAVMAGAQWWNQAIVSAASPVPMPAHGPLRRLPLGPGLALGFVVYLLVLARSTALAQIS